MKKLLTLLLALALLVPTALVMPASAAAEKEPFYTLSWSDFDEEKFPYLDGLLTTNFTNIGEYAVLGLNDVTDVKMQYGKYTDADVTKLANAMKEKLEARPEGKRYWHLFGPLHILKLAPDDVLFLDHAIDQLEDLTSALMKKMAEIGCPLDGVVIDTECYFMNSWYLWSNHDTHSVDSYYNNNKNLYAQIVKNPQYKTMIRPLLVEYGFPFWPNPSGHRSEIFTICPEEKAKDEDRYNHACEIWNTVVRIHQNRYANQWLYEPLKKYFPNATCSDYQSKDSLAWYKISSVDDGGAVQSGGNSIRVGTASSYSYYYNSPSAKDYAANRQIASYNDGVYEQSPFNSLMYEINFTRHMYASTDTGQIAPWICSYLYSSSDAYWGNTPYYSELLYHLGLFDPEPFLLYNMRNEVGGDAGWELTGETANAIMKALSDVAGYADRKPIELPQYWNAEYIVSGMYCGGRNLWRITPNTDEISLKSFKVKDSDPTFSVKGQTITFPGGKILADATIPNVGACGYWVETPANVTPVMTSDADRYAKYPSFGENFDSYENGKLTTGKMAQSFAWAIRTQKGDTAEVVDDRSGKALALTGNANFENISIPAKITAGDSYAKNQTWEITFTLPSGLSANAEIYLLKYAGDSAKNGTDGGIKIQGGKVYFGETQDGITEYQTLTDIKPGTYTLKRVMNFGDPKNFTYDLYLLDSKGKEITSTKNVSTASFAAIQSISFSTKKADKAVSLDNYKLYPSGFATDFALYDAATGINIQDKEKTSAKSTAYRLSWLNGTNATKTVTVVAAYYEGTTLKSEKAVKMLTMKPGHDGVDTGIVEVKAGQSVKVYLKGGVQQDAAPNQPDANENENKTQPTEGQEGGASATKATASASKATKASRVTKATKVPTRASRATKATNPGQTLAPQETLATDATAETLAPGETLAPEETLAPTESIDVPVDETKDDGNNTVLIIVIAAVAVLAVAGGLTFFLLKKKKPAAPAEATETPEE